MLKTNDIEKKSAKPCKTVFHSFAFFFLLLVKLQYLNNRNTNKHEILHVYIIHILLVACAQCCYISVNPFTSCVTDRYQLQQYNIIETKLKLA